MEYLSQGIISISALCSSVDSILLRVSCNFLPDGDNGSYKWYKHDWQYEAEYYRKHEVPIRVLF